MYILIPLSIIILLALKTYKSESQNDGELNY